MSNTMPGMIDTQRASKRRGTRRRVMGLVLAGILGLGAGTGAYVVQSETADAGSRVAVNKFIRANGGIVPCTHEDGSNQPKPCYWNAKKRGNGKGDSYIIVKRDVYVYLTGPDARRIRF